MKLKQIILILIIVALLALAGMFFYKSVNKKPAPAPVATQSSAVVPNDGTGVAGTEAAPATSATILPHGNNLDFGTVKKYNPSSQLNQYPAVIPEEIGSGLNDVVSQ